MRINNENWWVTVETPVHYECAELAMQLCPYLNRNGINPQPFPTEYYRVIAQFVGGEAMQSEYGLKIKADQEIIGHLKIGIPANFIKITEQS